MLHLVIWWFLTSITYTNGKCSVCTASQERHVRARTNSGGEEAEDEDAAPHVRGHSATVCCCTPSSVCHLTV